MQKKDQVTGWKSGGAKMIGAIGIRHSTFGKNVIKGLLTLVC